MAPAYILREKRQQRRIVIVRTAITLSALLGACYLLQHPRNERSPQLRFSSFRIVPEHAAATDIGGGGSNLSAGVSGKIPSPARVLHTETFHAFCSLLMRLLACASLHHGRTRSVHGCRRHCAIAEYHGQETVEERLPAHHMDRKRS